VLPPACGLLSNPVLALEAEVLPAFAAGLHRAGAFWGGWMYGYSIYPTAEWLLVRRQPLLLKLHRQFKTVCVVPMGVIACSMELVTEMLGRVDGHC